MTVALVHCYHLRPSRSCLRVQRRLKRRRKVVALRLVARLHALVQKVTGKTMTKLKIASTFPYSNQRPGHLDPRMDLSGLAGGHEQVVWILVSLNRRENLQLWEAWLKTMRMPKNLGDAYLNPLVLVFSILKMKMTVDIIE